MKSGKIGAAQKNVKILPVKHNRMIKFCRAKTKIFQKINA